MSYPEAQRALPWSAEQGDVRAGTRMWQGLLDGLGMSCRGAVGVSRGAATFCLNLGGLMLWAMRLTLVSRSGVAARAMSASIPLGGGGVACGAWVMVRLNLGGAAGSSLCAAVSKCIRWVGGYVIPLRTALASGGAWSNHEKIAIGWQPDEGGEIPSRSESSPTEFRALNAMPAFFEAVYFYCCSS